MLPLALAAAVAIQAAAADGSAPPFPSVDELVVMTDARFREEAQRFDLDRAGDKAEAAQLVEALSEAWVEREVQRVTRSRPVKLHLASRPRALPAHLHGASPDLERAWRTYRSLADTADHDLKKYRGRRPEGANLDAPLLRFLQGRDHHLLARAMSANWGSRFCGTGIDVFLRQQSLAILMGALHDRSYAVAVHAALKLDDLDLVPPDFHLAWSRRLLDHFGLDWEEIYAGMALDPESLTPFSSGIERRLVESGSERSVGFLLNRWKLDSRPNLDHVLALSEFLTPGPRRQTESWIITGGQFRYRREAEPVPLPDDVQRSILQDLASYLTPTSDEGDWTVVMEVLHDLCRPETRDAVQRATSLPNALVQTLARETLASMADN